MGNRIWELDATRGFAVLGMLLYHLAYDLNYFDFSRFPLTSPVWTTFARTVASIFFLVVGVSLYLSYSRSKNSLSTSRLIKKYSYRGLKLFSWGMGITVITFVLFPDQIIWFGALHFIGSAILVSFFLLRIEDKIGFPIVLPVTVIILICWWGIHGVRVDWPWLLWLGIIPEDLSTLDYFPLIPWLSVVLGGIKVGSKLYSQQSSALSASHPQLLHPICTVGRNSFYFYLLHQPVFFGAIYLIALTTG